MTIISATYFLIFLPLLSALFCQIFPHKKFPQSIVFLQFFAIFFLVGAIFYKVFKVGEISSDFAIFPLSIALEFNINVVSASFLAILIFLKVAILFFYKDEISKFLNEKNRALFYSVNCLNIFAIIGILTTNNLLNLFLFLEIYSISFFAIFSIASDKKISLLSFNQFFLNAASSLILLFCFIIIYLNFGIFEFSTIKENLLLKENSSLLKTLALLIFSSFFVRFFPFWLYFQNLKNTNLFAIFFAVHILFIQANLGFFLILKFYYLFFSKISTSLILIFLAIFLSFYSAFRIFISKHLKIIAINFCLNNFAFILICLAIKSQIAFGAAFFYWLGFNFLGFSLFIFATFLKRKFNTSLIDRIAVLALSESKIIRALLLPMKVLLIFIAALPFTFLFYANFDLALSVVQNTNGNSALQFYHFPSFFSPFVITSIIVSQFAFLVFAFKLMTNLFYAKSAIKFDFDEIDVKKYANYLISFWILIILLAILAFNSEFLHNLAQKFSLNLMNNLQIQ